MHIVLYINLKQHDMNIRYSSLLNSAQQSDDHHSDLMQ